MRNKLCRLLFLLLLASAPSLAVFPLGAVVMMLPHANISSEWTPAEGQTLPIFQNLELFSILGTTYGGDGSRVFALPDLRGRFIIATNEGAILATNLTSRVLGDQDGREFVSLLAVNLPSHSHTVIGTAEVATSPSPSASFLSIFSISSGVTTTAGNLTSASLASISPTGSSMPFDKMSPFITIAHFICTNVSGCARSGIPVGLIMPNINNCTFMTESQSGGWLPATGSSVPELSHTQLREISFAVNLTVSSGGIELPNLSERSPIGWSPGPTPGIRSRGILVAGGSQSALLTPANLPGHNHPLQISTNIDSQSGPFLRAVSASSYCTSGSAPARLRDNAIGASGSNNSSLNIEMPSASVSFIICVRDGGCGFTLPLGTLLHSSAPDASQLSDAWQIPDGREIRVSSHGGLFNVTSQYWGAIESNQSFRLPDLRGRTLFGASNASMTLNRPLGLLFGSEKTFMTLESMPSHLHSFQVSRVVGSRQNCRDNVFSTASSGSNIYVDEYTTETSLDSSTIKAVGNNTAIDIMKPFLVLNQYLCTHDAGCSSGGCSACGCTLPFAGATCGPNGTWLINQQNTSSAGPSVVVLTAPVVASSNLTIINSSVVFYNQGVSSITVVDGCLIFGSGTSLVLNLDAATLALLQEQLIASPTLITSLGTNISASCVSGTFESVQFANGLQPEAQKCHTSSVKHTGNLLSVVFDPKFIAGCEAPPANAPVPSSVGGTSNGLDSPASLNLALIVSLSVVGGLVLIAVVLALTVPPIRKRVLPMMHYNKTSRQTLAQRTSSKNSTEMNSILGKQTQQNE